ncbi:MAG: hypothetical protein ISS69_17710 [Phycisphaerae bacterium]|nr:hypothetical protein [Phycisphaerae bacterium]
MARSPYADNVFINCPFDLTYTPMFQAIVFAVFDCGYVARCALEIDDASQVRIDRISRIIAESKFGIHDLSRTELDKNTKLPRFNMPLELGMFLGAKLFGSKKPSPRACLILDREQYRYQSFISDIAGQDIKSHDNLPEKAISIVRNWLSDSSRRTTIPGSGEICRRYRIFRSELPKLCSDIKIEEDELTFNDYTNIVSFWLREAGRA